MIISTRSRALSLALCAFSTPFLSQAASAEDSTRIGNFYYQAPNGIAFIKNDSAAFVIDPGGPTNAGTSAPDDSFHRIIFAPTINGTGPRLDFQWSRQGNVVVGRIVSAKPGETTFKLGENWPGFSSQYTGDAAGVKGTASLADGTAVTWAMRTQPAPKSADATHITLDLAGPSHPAYIIAGFGELPSFNGIDQLLATAAQAYDRRRAKAVGPSGNILAAIADNVNNSRMYASDTKMVAISVSRTFSVSGPNDCPFFCWDSFFSALLAGIDDPAMAHQTVRAILSSQAVDGLVPNFCHWSHSNSPSRASDDRSQPPVGAMCIWKIHQRWPDADFLREVYPKLALWHGWWMKERNAKNDGLLEWGSSTGTLQGAQYETGWDDTPHFEGVPGVKMVGHTMNVYAVDLCSLWAMDAHYLALIADAIGKPDDAQKYRADEKDMNARINAKLWNEKLGIYCSRFWDGDNGPPGEFLTRLTPANFYPLISGAPDQKKANVMLAIMADPDKFWGDWILPTVTRHDPLFLGQTYWHGTIWGPVNYLVFQGVKRYAGPELEASFAQKSVRIFMNNWVTNGQCGENFLSLDGAARVGGNPNYTWGALMCLIGVESVVDIGDDGIPHPGPGYNEPVQITNLPIGGKPYNASIHLGKPEASLTPQ